VEQAMKKTLITGIVALGLVLFATPTFAGSSMAIPRRRRRCSC
jgi:hypothetical protein